MDNQQIPEGYRTDPATGYLESLSGEGIQPKHLTGFLKIFKKSGDQTKAIETQGYTYTDLEWFFQNDAVFKKDYRNVLLSMRHEIESVMYEQSLKPSGHKARQDWLRVNFPEDYAPKAVPKGQKQKSRLDTLLDDLA